jgi:hypothetical protein
MYTFFGTLCIYIRDNDIPKCINTVFMYFITENSKGLSDFTFHRYRFAWWNEFINLIHSCDDGEQQVFDSSCAAVHCHVATTKGTCLSAFIAKLFFCTHNLV